MEVSAKEYAVMRAWLAHVAPKVFSSPPLTPETDPDLVLDAIEAKSARNARKGLSMALSDIVEMTEFWQNEQMAEIDHDLAERGLPTLTDMRLRFSKALRRIMRRGSISNETEYYIVRNAADSIGPAQPEIRRLLADFEARFEN